MSSFDLQQGDLDELHGSVLLISASAGTGKTWTITHLATRWLLTDPRADPAQLLMVTFSRAAAAELKARLRQRVVEVGRYLDGTAQPSSSDRWAIDLLATTERSAIEKLRRRQRWVLSRLDEVNARTIHAFVASTAHRTSGETTDGKKLGERAVNEALTAAALRHPEALRTLLPDPLEPDRATGVMKAGTLRTNLRNVVESSVGLGGLAPAPGGATSMAIPDLRAADEEGHARASRFLDLVVATEHRSELLHRLESATTFNSLIASLYWDVVGGGDRAIERLRSAFSFVLIDEFQDTDLAQWEIFERVFVGHVPMVIVGDPKQAIYGFRGGDVVIFQDLLTRSATQQGTYRSTAITNNFRSGPDLLGCLNALFLSAQDQSVQRYFDTVATGKPLGEGLARGWGFSSPLQTAPAALAPIVYDAVGVGERGSILERGRFIVRDVSEEVPRAALDPQGRRPDSTLGSVVSSADGKSAKQAILDDLVHYLHERRGEQAGEGEDEFSLGDVLILVQSNSFGAQVRDHLRRHGIPAITNKTESVWASEAATQLRTLLWILSDPLNPRRVGLLRYTWFAHHPFDEMPELAEIMATSGPSTVARRLLDATSTAAVLATERPERNWTDLDHALDLVTSAFRHGVDPLVVLNWVEDQIAETQDRPEDAAVTRRIESDGQAISIMTLHAAKGLERRIVLIPEVEGSPDSKAMPARVAALSTPEGRQFALASMSGSEMDVELESDLARQSMDEAARLLYVGLTRARSELVVWLSDLNRHAYAEKAKLPTLIAKTSLWRLLVDSYLLTTAEEAAALAAACEESGAPFVRGIEFHERDEARRPPAMAAVGPSQPPIDTEGVQDPPVIESPLRRWSYSALNVHGAKTTAIDLVDIDEELSAYDAGVFAEDADLIGEDEDGPTRRLGGKLFGGLAGNVVGTAIHKVFEDIVGVTPSSNDQVIRTAVESAYQSLALPLRDPDRVTAEFQMILSHPLGPSMGGMTLDGLVSEGRPRVAREMRFMLPLLGPGDRSDRLVDIARLVAEQEPDGPYAEFFGGLAASRPKRSRLLQGYLTGSIDLVARRDDGRFVVLDYKSNLLKDAASYAPDLLVGEMSQSGYPLQGLLYSVALHRFLSGRLEGYRPEVHLGGIAYYYVRGAAIQGARPGDGVAAWDIPVQVVTGVSTLLANEALS